MPLKYRSNNKAVPTLLYFWTEQCSQCRFSQKPVIQKLLSKDANFNLVSINALEDREMANLLKIRTVPSTAVFSNEGKSMFVNNGLIGEDELLIQLKQSYI